jgi:hypothetical protein
MENENLEKKAIAPKKIEIDGQVVENHSLSDLAEFDKYLEAKKAIKRKTSGIKFTKMMSSGA